MTKYRDTARLNRFLYWLGDITVGSRPAPPPRTPEALTYVSSCLSRVYGVFSRRRCVAGCYTGALTYLTHSFIRTSHTIHDNIYNIDKEQETSQLCGDLRSLIWST